MIEFKVRQYNKGIWDGREPQMVVAASAIQAAAGGSVGGGQAGSERTLLLDLEERFLDAGFCERRSVCALLGLVAQRANSISLELGPNPTARTSL